MIITSMHSVSKMFYYTVVTHSQRKLHFLNYLMMSYVLYLHIKQTWMPHEQSKVTKFIFLNGLQHAITKYLGQISLHKNFKVRPIRARKMFRGYSVASRHADSWKKASHLHHTLKTIYKLLICTA